MGGPSPARDPGRGVAGTRATVRGAAEGCTRGKTHSSWPLCGLGAHSLLQKPPRQQRHRIQGKLKEFSQCHSFAPVRNENSH